jgi:hypothetical protein
VAEDAGAGGSHMGLAVMGVAALGIAASSKRGRRGLTVRGPKAARRVATVDSVRTVEAEEAEMKKASDRPSTETTEINYYELDKVSAEEVLTSLRKALGAAEPLVVGPGSAGQKMEAVLSDLSVQTSLIAVSRLPVFSHEMGLAFKENLDLLSCLKQLKYFWNLPQGQLAILLKQAAHELEGAGAAERFEAFQTETAGIREPVRQVAASLPGEAGERYRENAIYLETADPHAVYPTSIYRQCDALTLATKDAATIEAAMSTTITTTITTIRRRSGTIITTILRRFRL